MRPAAELNIRLLQASQPEWDRTCTVCIGGSVMEIHDALRIMRALADGVNPGTGDALGAEDQQVCEELRRGVDVHQIAKTHNRSIGSIAARLGRLGKMGSNTPPDRFDSKVA